MAARKVVLILMAFMFGKLKASCNSNNECVKFETQPIINNGPNKTLNFTLNICNDHRYSLKAVDVEVKSHGTLLLCALNVGPDAHVKSGACSCDLYLHGLSRCSVTRKNAISSELWHLTAVLENGERVRHCLEVPFTEESNTIRTEATEVRKLTRKPTSLTVAARELTPIDYYWQPTETPSDAILTDYEKGTDNKPAMYIGLGCLGVVVLIAIVSISVVVHRKRTGHDASRSNHAQLDAIQMRPLPVLPAVPVVQDNRDSVLTETDDTYARVQDDSGTGQVPLFKTDAEGYLCPKTTASSREAMPARTSAESRGFPSIKTDADGYLSPKTKATSSRLARMSAESGGFPSIKTDADGYLCPKTSATLSRLARTSAESRGFPSSQPYGASPAARPATVRGVVQGRGQTTGQQTTRGSEQDECGEGGYMPMHPPFAR